MIRKELSEKVTRFLRSVARSAIVSLRWARRINEQKIKYREANIDVWIVRHLLLYISRALHSDGVDIVLKAQCRF